MPEVGQTGEKAIQRHHQGQHGSDGLGRRFHGFLVCRSCPHKDRRGMVTDGGIDDGEKYIEGEDMGR
ncbi:hypothetical protein [Geotalea toluenoxydans]|uniref:hypothetical protein n=1 Tax=Geotalea toluenoxydans TaxID=421624 RepID=UPI0006D12296|nr:hypothetical protein [Geotalea toluenoxydans]